MVSLLSGEEPVVIMMTTILLIPINFGMASFFLSFIRFEEVDKKMLFSGYNQFGRIFELELRAFISVFLWSLLLIIPGIIKGLSYSMSYYILKDNPDMKPSEALVLSEIIMDGRKIDYLMLQLSFVGWAILSIFTLGLLAIWLAPYINTSCAYFYEESLRIHENKAESVFFQ